MTHKTCIKCKCSKPVSEFHGHNTTKDRLTTACKICFNEQCRDAHYRKRYGLTAKQADTMKTECEFCKVTVDLHIDHCHTTGKVRGVLCTNCNRGLGHFQENPALLRLAAEYIEKHNGT